MKIEKLNDQQIRCTLTREDLAARNIKLTELAYGTEKIRELFRDMMDQASMDFGFEADDIPLMVEAIPMSSEKIVLIITKVESPDELDTRFSEFSHCREMDESISEEADEEDASVELDLPEELIKLLSQIRQELAETNECPAEIGQKKQGSSIQLFTFEDMDAVFPAAQAVAPSYRAPSTLYRDEASGEYLLFLYQGDHSSMEFNRICRTMTAYLKKRTCTSNTEAYCREHAKVILSGNAVQMLAEI